MKAYSSINLATNSWNATNDGSYQETFKYDANGNILKLTRNGKLVTTGATSPLAMDDLTYKYETIANGYTRNTNRLRSVSDAVGNGNYADDIDNQANNNYDYDEIGNLKSDVQEGIATIEWTVSGKISKVTRTAGSTKSDLEFKYDALGKRITKIEKPAATKGDESTWITTYYVRDASGNVMSTYERRKTTTVQEFFWKEQLIYGSSRFGYVDKTKNFTTLGAASSTLFATKTGIKLFEGSNHLGNVLVVFTDLKRPVVSGTNVLSYTGDSTAIFDYYAFGNLMPARKYIKTNYRYGFNGQEKDDEFSGSGNSYTAEFWQYDARLGRRWNLDPVIKVYESGYSTFGNNPVVLVDLLGADATSSTGDENEGNNEGGGTSNGQNPQGESELDIKPKLTGSTSLYIYLIDYDPAKFDNTKSKQQSGKWDYVVAKNLQEAEVILKKEYGEKTDFIQNMVIRSHGYPGGMWWDGRTISGEDLQYNEISETKSLTYFRGLLTNNATIFTTACNLCMGPEVDKGGRAFAAFFTAGTLRNYYANWATSKATYGTDDGNTWLKFDGGFAQPGSTGSFYGGFVNYFWGSLSHKPILEPKFYQLQLNSKTGNIDRIGINIPFKMPDPNSN